MSRLDKTPVLQKVSSQGIPFPCWCRGTSRTLNVYMKLSELTAQKRSHEMQGDTNNHAGTHMGLQPVMPPSIASV